MKKKIKAFIQSTFLVEFGQDGIEESSNLFQLGLIDSFGYVELVGFLEKEFEVKITDEELMSEALASLDSIVALVESKLPIESGEQAG